VEAFDPGLAPRPALWEAIVAAMRHAIILGELRPGLHLEEPALAEKFGVSRIPVREALTRLAHEGLVRIEPRRGAFVVGVTEADIRDIYELRSVIEGHAIRRATGRVDAAGLVRLRTLADQMAEAVRENHTDRVAGPDVTFHREIVALAGSPRLLAAWDPIGGMVSAFLRITNTTYPYLPRSVASHYAMIDFLEQGDADRAQQELRLHLQNGESLMVQAMRDVHAALSGAPEPG
jgi:DNA-binding GntR family transcriptional regulator